MIGDMYIFKKIIFVLLFSAEVAFASLDGDIPERVVSLYGGFTEILEDIGGIEYIIGKTKSDTLFPQLDKITVVGTTRNINVELIIALEPDLVICKSSTVNPELIGYLRKYDIDVISLDINNFDELFNCYRLLGQIFGKEERAELLIKKYRNELEYIKTKREKGGDRKKVFFEVRQFPLTAAGRKNIVNEIIEYAGGINVVDVDKKLVKYNFENLVSVQPDFYIIQKGPMNVSPSDLRARANYQLLKAVKKGNYFFVDEEIFSRPGPRNIKAVSILSEILYKRVNKKEKVIDKAKDTFSVIIAKKVLRLAGVIFIGLAIGVFLEEFYFGKKLLDVIRRYVRLGRFSAESRMAFFTMFFSGIAANTLLSQAYSERKITRKELIMSSILNSFPGFLRHLPTSMFLAISILGIVGVYYMGILVATSFARTCIIVLASFILFERNNADSISSFNYKDSKSGHFFKSLFSRFQRIVFVTIPIYIIVILLQERGVFERLNTFFAGFMPSQVITIVLLKLSGSVASSYSAAREFLSIGFNIKLILISLLLGDIFGVPLNIMKHHLPSYSAIFGFRTGLQLVFIIQFARIITIGAVIFILCRWL